MMGFLAGVRWPKPILKVWIGLFRAAYKIDFREVAARDYHNFNEFFTRELRPECRPIEPHPASVACPVDGVVGCFGTIDEGTLFQAKGIPYSLKNLVVDDPYVEIFQKGSYITLYLSPRHYHRIHAPISGAIEELFYIPGHLFPVNSFAIENIPGIFTLNERLLTLLSHPTGGKVGVVKVGATVVGKIKVVYDTVESNTSKKTISKQYENLSIQKGAELGRFELGSTVILLFSQKISFRNLQPRQEVLFGQAIADFSEVSR